MYAVNIDNREGSYRFDVNVKGKWLRGIELNMGGLHNIENAVAAIAVAKQLHIDDEKIKAAIAAFKGVKRRFEYIIPPSGKNATVYVDDYAHHPAELEALIKSAKLLFADKKCTVIFQPHLFSRTRDLAEAFAISLDMADEVILLPVYPARELPVAGVTSRLILDKMNNKSRHLMSKEEALGWIRKTYDRNKPNLLITAGAGDIDQLVQPVKEILER